MGYISKTYNFFSVLILLLLISTPPLISHAHTYRDSYNLIYYFRIAESISTQTLLYKASPEIYLSDCMSMLRVAEVLGIRLLDINRICMHSHRVSVFIDGVLFIDSNRSLPPRAVGRATIVIDTDNGSLTRSRFFEMYLSKDIYLADLLVLNKSILRALNKSRSYMFRYSTFSITLNLLTEIRSLPIVNNPISTFIKLFLNVNTSLDRAALRYLHNILNTIITEITSSIHNIYLLQITVSTSNNLANATSIGVGTGNAFYSSSGVLLMALGLVPFIGPPRGTLLLLLLYADTPDLHFGSNNYSIVDTVIKLLKSGIGIQTNIVKSFTVHTINNLIFVLIAIGIALALCSLPISIRHLVRDEV